MSETIYEWDEFQDCLLYLGFSLYDVADFREHYQNLLTPEENFKTFQKYVKGMEE